MTCYAACFSDQPERFRQVFARGRWQQLSSLCQLHPRIVTQKTLAEELPLLSRVEVIFSSWGMFTLSPQNLDSLPNLKAVFYAAGTTDYFSSSLLSRGITVVSAWRANAVPVAEFCLAQILLACKGYFQNHREYCSTAMLDILSSHSLAFGAYGERVALLGAGAISQTLAGFLQPFSLDVVTVPSRPERRTVSLEEAFETAFVISNHLPNRYDNVGVLDGSLFRRMRPGAVFINTGRGLQVNEADLIDVFTERSELTALLDVTKPEPPIEGSPLYRLPNIHLSSHIAGALNHETQRLADCVLGEFKRWLNGDVLCHQVNKVVTD
ncbi:hydroxyacid dehydrogenase [Yersinia intermedia]|uniref:hydroxyacid dehydrogenase n=1 Tax=Yersinia intermedia TaxID=631 RepID=UPI000B71D3EB|nr:hydroxyacid dehydrogenase [Yersinia intermedia]MCW8114170.1 hydroxyacid dehydrogenase [Yersinia intermedia]MDA5518938.1 hydroxyacid dehydrogenase [Yersinia intermedia]OWF86793.1 phosphoglycerate dehydrogenase [Yersinia intermedia]